MNSLLLCLPVFLPIAVGLASYAIEFRTEAARRWFYGTLICLTSLLSWIAILNTGDEAVTVLHFTRQLSVVFRLDGAGRIFAGLCATLWPVAMVYGFDYMHHEKQLRMFWSFFTAAFGITLGIAFAANMLTLYIFYEMLTLSTIPLVMQAMTRRAFNAGISYMVYSLSGAALGFIGLIYLIVNDAQDFVFGGHFAAYTGNMGLLLAVFTLSFVGCAVKAAIWPLHAWLPAAAVAPTPVTALLHAVAVVKAGAFTCIRLIYYAFGADVLRGTWAQYFVMALSIITIVYGSARAMREPHFKRRMAYSTISNLSYILFAATIMTPAGLVAAFLHFLFHSVAKILAFFATGAVRHYALRTFVAETEGLGRYMPITFACYTVSACALTGIPPFNGFVSKWYIGVAALQGGSPMEIMGFIGLLISALFTAIYMFQVVIKAWFPDVDSPFPAPPESTRDAHPLMTVPMILLSVACLVMGLFPQWLIDLIGKVVGL